MRTLVFTTMVLAAAATSSSALEASAGADTINASQIGLNAKIEAGNTVLQTGLNNVIACNKDGKLWTASGCIPVDEPLAKKIAGCTTDKKFYDQNTGACMDSAPDLTAQLNTTNDTMAKLIACYNAHGTFNASTSQCASGGSGAVKVVGTYGSTMKNKNSTTIGPYKADLCMLSYQWTSAFDNPVLGCKITGGPGAWKLTTISSYSRQQQSCSITCFNLN
ncbi:hypothetical protein RLW55_05940 [Hyphomicrobium sp. B1]|uniref:hypothetical protein n=1 Tax=Hyphomicrobium sp. B1 TaxID=3075651 RepID=UPI003C2F061A